MKHIYEKLRTIRWQICYKIKTKLQESHDAWRLTTRLSTPALTKQQTETACNCNLRQRFRNNHLQLFSTWQVYTEVPISVFFFSMLSFSPPAIRVSWRKQCTPSHYCLQYHVYLRNYYVVEELYSFVYIKEYNVRKSNEIKER